LIVIEADPQMVFTSQEAGRSGAQNQRAPLSRNIWSASAGQPSARSSAQPNVILSATTKPDYRSCEYLLDGMHASIVGAPRFHVLGMHSVDRKNRSLAA